MHSWLFCIPSIFNLYYIVAMLVIYYNNIEQETRNFSNREFVRGCFIIYSYWCTIHFYILHYSYYMILWDLLATHHRSKSHNRFLGWITSTVNNFFSIKIFHVILFLKTYVLTSICWQPSCFIQLNNMTLIPTILNLFKLVVVSSGLLYMYQCCVQVNFFILSLKWIWNHME